MPSDYVAIKTFVMKLGSKYNLLNTHPHPILKYKQIYWSKYLQSVEKIHRVDFTKYALSTIIYQMQSIYG